MSDISVNFSCSFWKGHSLQAEEDTQVNIPWLNFNLHHLFIPSTSDEFCILDISSSIIRVLDKPTTWSDGLHILGTSVLQVTLSLKLVVITDFLSLILYRSFILLVLPSQALTFYFFP